MESLIRTRSRPTASPMRDDVFVAIRPAEGNFYEKPATFFLGMHIVARSRRGDRHRVVTRIECNETAATRLPFFVITDAGTRLRAPIRRR
ncbi:hypothetical protein [Lysobacter auxotrophicus]|uniref:Uncharacterized protein n=1 Tax=Lysobacter auxotrophicus TaxID=2992573 RepID=A0ABN6UF19_9GAMM|nr:hypothetical protein [Lysobacter auxotrophicus]BDU14871.1 hypothetical protein LA521A_00720 [Lysobacter auxotrophicus]